MKTRRAANRRADRRVGAVAREDGREVHASGRDVIELALCKGQKERGSCVRKKFAVDTDDLLTTLGGDAVRSAIEKPHNPHQPPRTPRQRPQLLREAVQPRRALGQVRLGLGRLRRPLSTICTVKHHVHQRRRATLNPFFSKARVAGRIDIVQRSVLELCRKVDEFAAGSRSVARISLGAAISAFTRDVATEFVIGKRYHILDAQDFNAETATLPQTSGSLWQSSKHFPWYVSLMKRMPAFMVKRTGGDGVNAFIFFLQDMMKVTMEYYSTLTSAPPNDDGPGDKTRTIVYEILNAPIPPAEKSLSRVFEEVGTITRGGFETVANSLRMILYHIYADQEVLRRLRLELSGARRDKTTNNHASLDIGLGTIEQLPYLTAVLMEGLRLSPGLSTRAQRIAPDRDLVYDNRVIPAGTPIGMTTLLMHYDPALYPDPKRFDPERWMDRGLGERPRRPMLPLGGAPGSVLGCSNLAWAELYLVVAALVQRFDFRFDPAAMADVECSSDQFIIGTSGWDGLKTFVSRVPV
ncbi:trichodiene oxygenase [Apiospora hydei]|uniref:Trichodiene oxygenase n=1 Tax=Apiospora hydei TaxID=1337664 RepID=A0ABR1VGX5_9PEZI